jgi:hypothetical protein
VAAHSTVRALYGAYTGPLYQVRNAANSLKDIPVGADGYVDISVQDTFCSGTTCTIATIYDQSPNKNNLTKSPTCLWLPNGGVEASATQGKISINGHTAYGVYVDNTGDQSNSVGYRNNSTKGVPTGDNPEATYMVLDGTRSSSICCFDYGNVETDGKDDGNATMEAIYWGTDSQFGQSGGGNGPWVAADLENGMFEGYENGSEKVPSNTSITGWAYVTAMLKGLSAPSCPTGLTSSGCFELKAANAASGKLQVKFNADTGTYGARPPGYTPMKKQGAIVLGTGGDGSNFGQGTFFEGVITEGAPPDSIDDLIQANIVAAGYGK